MALRFYRVAHWVSFQLGPGALPEPASKYPKIDGFD